MIGEKKEISPIEQAEMEVEFGDLFSALYKRLPSTEDRDSLKNLFNAWTTLELRARLVKPRLPRLEGAPRYSLRTVAPRKAGTDEEPELPTEEVQHIKARLMATGYPRSVQLNEELLVMASELERLNQPVLETLRRINDIGIDELDRGVDLLTYMLNRQVEPMLAMEESRLEDSAPVTPAQSSQQ